MDMKVSGASNLQLQSEFGQHNIDNSIFGKASVAGANNQRQQVLLRNADTFKKVAEGYYDKKEVYQGTSSSYASEAEQAMEVANKEATALDCINVLKENVTPEDYNALEEWGLIPDEDNPEAFVTVYERIQIELAAYCEDYAAPSLNVSDEKMKAVLGSEAMAGAVSKIEDIAKETGTLTDDTKKYILGNNLEPTLENVYKAIHSGAVASTGQMTLSAADWQQLQGQVESFFTTNGIEVNQANLDGAKWLISENVPLTVENFTKLQGLDQVDFGDASYIEELKQDVAYTIYFGGNPMTTGVTGETYDMDTVTEAVDAVQNAMDQDVDYILKNNRKLNIENLKYRIAERQREDAKKQRQGQAVEEYTQSSKLLMEARAVLTQGSLLSMQKVGINITYTEITVMVDIAHGQNMSLSAQILMLDGTEANETEQTLLTRAMEIMAGFPSLPIGVAGSIYSESIEFTVESVYAEGQLMASRYKAAMETYEAVGTEVRGDLGDNIRKAFGNIDDLLSENGIEINDANRRSARVLGYNSMEITVESVEAIGEITSQLDDFTANLTPRAAMYLIRNGITPLNTDIRQLNERLRHINEEIGGKSRDEKYSEFLWKLEKRGGISEDERAAYIQLYRVLNQVNAYDGRVLGAVSKAGQEMTLANLYTAVKTKQTGGIDKKLDAEFGLLESTYTEDALTAYMEGARSIMEDDALHREYQYERMQEKLDMIWQPDTMSEQEFMRYISGIEGTSINNIYTAMMVGDKHFHKKLMSMEDDNVTGAVDRISNAWESEADGSGQAVDTVSTEATAGVNGVAEMSEDSLIENYRALESTLSGENTEVTFEKSVLRTDMSMAVSFMARQAEKRSYYIPMEISGETTMVHMTLKEGSLETRGRITLYAEVRESKLSVIMYRRQERYETLAATDSEELRDRLGELVDGNVVVTDRVYDGMWNETTTNTDGANVSYGELVRQAKSFIHNVLKKI